MTSYTFFAPSALGIEDLLGEELRVLGAERVRAARAGVAFSGSLETAYRACLWSRTASRVLLRLAEVPASDAEELYENVRAIAWEDHLAADGTLAVDFTGARSPITHSHYGALKVKDAVVDRFRDRTGKRPSVDTESPDVRINVAARTRSAVISIDLAGDALHRRGYRAPGEQAEAPLKETLAAAVLLFAGWPEIAAGGGALIDPMCGSGTLVIEGASMAGDRAPGLLRHRWGFDRWLGHDAEVWAGLLDEADARAEAGASTVPPIRATDNDPRAVELARACVARAGLSTAVDVDLADVRELAAPGTVTPSGAAAIPGLLVTNPPYGERLGTQDEAATLLETLGSRAREALPGYRVAVISAREAPLHRMQLPEHKTCHVYNGRIPAAVTVFSVPGRKAVAGRGPGEGTAGGECRSVGSFSADSMFANRLRKNVKRLGKWARRTGVSCYRLYDADMPEFAVAVDLYHGAGPDEGGSWLHVAEYAPPKDVDPVAARRRLDEVIEVLPEVTGVPPENVHLKVRVRQKGDSQYERLGRSGRMYTVSEAGLVFLVNLTDYLDTGLFLDHRPTRALVRELAGGGRFLNLFAYTGAATVYAVAGGARESLTIDMSNTYLDWARRNLALNALDGGRHEFLRADVLDWLEKQEPGRVAPFDLIFCDPPTFSTSKRMEGTLDVQRDHAGLLGGLGKLLAPGGTILFSNNFRRFKMDHAGLRREGLCAEDITASTIPEDFARNPRIHNTWRISRDGGG